MTGEAWEPRSLEILGGATGHQFCFLLGSWLLLMPRWSGRGREMTTRTQDIICSFVRSFVRSFVHSFMRSFIHSFMHSQLPVPSRGSQWALGGGHRTHTGVSCAEGLGQGAGGRLENDFLEGGLRLGLEE